MKKQVSYKIVSLVFGVLVVCFLAVFYILAWTEPTEAPPGGNVPAPLNVSNIGQTKEGGLILNTGGAPTGLIIDKGNVGIGTTGPGAKLEISYNAQAAGNKSLQLSGDTTGGWGRLYFKGSSGVAGVINRADPATDLYFGELTDTGKYIFRSTGDMTIAGNVGIGTTAPSSDGEAELKLDVEGPIGATVYCDENGNNCKPITEIGKDVIVDNTWHSIYFEDFENPPMVGWSKSGGGSITREQCGSSFILGRFADDDNNDATPTCVSKTFTNLPEHSLAKVDVDFFFGDTWDWEKGYIMIDGVEVYSEKSHYARHTDGDLCGWTYQERIDHWEIRSPHTSSNVTVQFCSNLDQANTDEWFGIDNLEIATQNFVSPPGWINYSLNGTPDVSRFTTRPTSSYNINNQGGLMTTIMDGDYNTYIGVGGNNDGNTSTLTGTITFTSPVATLELIEYKRLLSNGGSSKGRVSYERVFILDGSGWQQVYNKSWNNMSFSNTYLVNVPGPWNNIQAIRVEIYAQVGGHTSGNIIRLYELSGWGQ